MQKYEVELKGLIEIFDRKERLETEISFLLKELNRTEERENEINELKYFLENLNQQLVYEIYNFKSLRENDLLNIIKKFFKDKAESNIEIAQIFDINYNFKDK